MSKFYITTAIDYVNSRPHLGTAYEKVATDVIARYKRLCGFDTRFPDFWREREWSREFPLQVKNHNMPALSLVRFMTDHMGSFKTAIDGVNTPSRIGFAVWSRSVASALPSSTITTSWGPPGTASSTARTALLFTAMSISP